MTREELVDAVAEALARIPRIDADEHRTHHDYVANLIECSRRRREMFDKAVQHVAGWVAVGAVGWVGMQILKAIRGGS